MADRKKRQGVLHWLDKRLQDSKHPGTFGTHERVFNLKESEDAPGPQYYVRETVGRDAPSVSISSKGKRNFDLTGPETPAPSAYEHPPAGFISKEPRHAAFSFPQAQRFSGDSTTAAGSSSLSSRSAPGDRGAAESSASHLGVGTDTKKYSFGLRLNEKNRYYSTLLSLSDSCSPGPCYSLSTFAQAAQGRPAFTFGRGKKWDVSQLGGLGREGAGPGTYDPVASLRPIHGGFSFGGEPRAGPADGKRLMMSGRESEKALQGREGPGPLYNPGYEAVDPKPHGGTMGPPPRRGAPVSPTRGRRRRRSSGDEALYDVKLEHPTPGPGHYEPKKHVMGSPAASLVGKEKEVVDIFTNSTRHPRFVQQQAGIWSPGPKYGLPSTLGGPGFSIPTGGMNRKTAVQVLAEKRLADERQRLLDSGLSAASLPPLPMDDPDVGSKVGPGHYSPRHRAVEVPLTPMITIGREVRMRPAKRCEVPGPGTYPINPGLRALSRTRRVRGVPSWKTPSGRKGRGRPQMLKSGQDSPGPGRYFGRKSTLKTGGSRFGGLK